MDMIILVFLARTSAQPIGRPARIRRDILLALQLGDLSAVDLAAAVRCTNMSIRSNTDELVGENLIHVCQWLDCRRPVYRLGPASGEQAPRPGKKKYQKKARDVADLIVHELALAELTAVELSARIHVHDDTVRDKLRALIDQGLVQLAGKKHSSGMPNLYRLTMAALLPLEHTA